MASVVPGYEYDIFISYRQKDNKNDGWVTDFVNHLRGELEATFKEDISIYFDENPHDRLQESYNVDKSLEGKLKCLIFIPVLSQTYCDPESYAWQRELIPFIHMAENDNVGRDVRLKNGNVASRILPIRIHDLDTDDIKLFEIETGTVLRAIDFVFKTSSGVNRPLRENEDHPNDNLNKTFYRDQINKLAHAIKEIISSLKAGQVVSEIEAVFPPSFQIEVKRENIVPGESKYLQLSRRTWISVIILAGFIVIAGFLLFRGIYFTGNIKVLKDPDGKISIAVNFFDNSTNDSTLGWLKMGIPDLIRNNLAGSDQLSLQNSQTMNEVYESISHISKSSVIPSISREAAIKLNAGAYINGSFQKYGNKILTLVKLIDTKSDEVLWTGKAEGPLENITDVADSISFQLRNYLEIKALKQKAGPEYGVALTGSSEAYRKYIEGMQAYLRSDYKSALFSFQEACRIDTGFVLAKFCVANSYDAIAAINGDRNSRLLAAFWISKTYKYRNELPEYYRLWLEMWYAYYISKNSVETVRYCDLLQQSDIKSRYFWGDIAETYMIFGKYDKAFRLYQKIEKINRDWDEDWRYQHYYLLYSNCCHYIGMHEKENEVIQRGLKCFPDNIDLLWLKARIAIETEKDTAKASQILNVIAKSDGWSKSRILRSQANLYADINSNELAEKYYRLALNADKKDLYSIYALGNFLIDHNKNVNEGMAFLKILEVAFPGAYNDDFFYHKSLGLFRQGKFAAADSVAKMVSDSCRTPFPELDMLRKNISDSLLTRN
jgi:tetratricopeptide (TPR) repeat protein